MKILVLLTVLVTIAVLGVWAYCEGYFDALIQKIKKLRGDLK